MKVIIFYKIILSSNTTMANDGVLHGKENDGEVEGGDDMIEIQRIIM